MTIALLILFLACYIALAKESKQHKETTKKLERETYKNKLMQELLKLNGIDTVTISIVSPILTLDQYAELQTRQHFNELYKDVKK